VPRRAAPGDRAAIEAALTPELRASLEELRTLLNVADWQEVPALAQLFQQAACLLLAAEYVDRDGLAERDALDAAAIALDLSWNTVRSRAKRWPKDSRRQLRALCTRPSEDAGCSLQTEPERRSA
jgi:hypothetical protein